MRQRPTNRELRPTRPGLPHRCEAWIYQVHLSTHVKVSAESHAYTYAHGFRDTVANCHAHTYANTVTHSECVANTNASADTKAKAPSASSVTL